VNGIQWREQLEQLRYVDPRALLYAGGGLLVLGLFSVTYVVVADKQGLPARYWARYVAHLERKLRRMFIYTSGAKIASLQLAGLFAVFALYVVIDLPLWYLLAAVVVAGPPWYVERMRQKRVEEIEKRIDGFMLALANALKSTPSLGDALKSVQALTADPLRQEVELAVKEMRLGSTLDQALLLMASRVGSRALDSALSAILIGRQVGGNLPKILETTATTLREMERLEGVVRTKTAEGKMQLWVLAVFPLIMIFALNSVSPGYFEPLTQSLVGYAVTATSTLLWGASLVVARRILDVDV
jgi:tight adherence protein B